MRIIHELYGIIEDVWQSTSSRVFDLTANGTTAFFTLLQERRFRTFRSRTGTLYQPGDIVEVKDIKKPFFSARHIKVPFDTDYLNFSVNDLEMSNVKNGDILILVETRSPDESGLPFIFLFLHNGQMVAYLYYVDIFDALNPLPWHVFCRAPSR